MIDRHFMELVAPRQDAADLDREFAKFAERFGLFLERGHVICVTDNPMGHLSFMGPELMEFLGLPGKPDNLMIHLNTFHRKMNEQYDPAKEQNEQDLDIILQHALTFGIKYLLCVSGDGCQKFPRLKPEELGYDPEKVKTVTSVQLMEYIHKTYPGRFTCGAAFNQYEPAREEMEKLERKLGAGAAFIITQPVCVNEASDPRIVVANQNLGRMLEFADGRGRQVVLEAWMSQKFTHLIPECVGYDINFGDFDPWANLKDMRRLYPARKFYVSMVFGPQGMQKVEEVLSGV